MPPNKIREGIRVKQFTFWNVKSQRECVLEQGVIEFISECGRYARVKGHQKYTPRYMHSILFVKVEELQPKP